METPQIQLQAEIERFGSQEGEKSGWSYVFIPSALAEKLKPGHRQSFRVKGLIDQVVVNGMSLVPMCGGDFILAINGSLRKKLRKEAGNTITLLLEEDKDFKIELPEDLEMCLLDEPGAFESFMAQPKSHRNYFINWINQAKTLPTREKRLVMTVDAMQQGLDFGGMIRAGQARRKESGR
ncbi:YdeI/OmpD-associated family protein [Pedobacter sp. SYP-B3415]|uniref:YdeI/OmpD-associated family protein n=1 Tax=Pedobacter sp. SYP-B3415 TaxID=2496641 RepID=UPI001F0FF792|nr:YdeI/OmpD-associated family protein [Pedobacter sp. SYP-B3415]